MEELRQENAKLKGESADVATPSLPVKPMFGKAASPTSPPTSGIPKSRGDTRQGYYHTIRSCTQRTGRTLRSIYRRPRDQPVYTIYAVHPSGDHTKGKLTQWMKRYVPKEQQSSVETLVTSIKEEHGGRTTDWGLTNVLVAKVNLEGQLRLLAAIHFCQRLNYGYINQRKTYSI